VKTAAATSTYQVSFASPTPAPRPEPQGRVPRVARLLALAHRIDALIAAGELRDLADAARVLGLTRARVSQLMNLCLLAPRIQEAILELPPTTGRDTFTERSLRRIVAEPVWERQLARWRPGATLVPSKWRAGRTFQTSSPDTLSHQRDDLLSGRQHPQEPERAAVDHGGSVHENFEFAVAAVDHIHVAGKLAPKPRRHPDGVETGHSVRAVTNRDPGHKHLRNPDPVSEPTTVAGARGARRKNGLSSEEDRCPTSRPRP
jgi:hypothetical protein